jgi:hypothetical protein
MAGVDPANPFTFDITRDQPDNLFQVGDQQLRLGSFQVGADGKAFADIFGDFKRHDMGPDNAEEITRIDEAGNSIPGSVFITAELWGVGSSAPYLHDGSATTLQEAVTRGHGGEAAPERDAFRALSSEERGDLLRFLDNLKLALFEDAGGA